MEINIVKNEGQEKQLEITAPWQLVEEEYKDILRKYTKLPLKGFRPGKAPVSAIESFFRNELKNELVAATSTRLCRRALKESGLEAGTTIEVSDVEVSKYNYLRFKAAFIEMPAFELSDYRRLEIEATDTDGKLDEISRKLLDRTIIDLHPTFIENERRYSEPAENHYAEEGEVVAERVKLMLILKKIALLDAIEVDARDVDERIHSLAIENDVTYEELRNYLFENNSLSRLTDTLLAEAVLHYLIEEQL